MSEAPALAVWDPSGAVATAARFLGLPSTPVKSAKAAAAFRGKALVLAGGTAKHLDALAGGIERGLNVLCFDLGPQGAPSLGIAGPPKNAEAEPWEVVAPLHPAAAVSHREWEGTVTWRRLQGRPLAWEGRGNLQILAAGRTTGRPVLAEFARGLGRAVVCQLDAAAACESGPAGRALTAALLRYVVKAEPWRPRATVIFGRTGTPRMRSFDRVAAIYSRNPELPALHRRDGQPWQPEVIVLCGDDASAAYMAALNPRWTDEVARCLYRRARVVFLGVGDRMREPLGRIAGTPAELLKAAEEPRVDRRQPLAQGMSAAALRLFTCGARPLRFKEDAACRTAVAPGLLLRLPFGVADLVVCQFDWPARPAAPETAHLRNLLTNLGIGLKHKP
jgi:hypothetical protein